MIVMSGLQLQNPQVGGVILFSRNIQSRDQVCDLVAEIRACSKYLLVAVDQEGGKGSATPRGVYRHSFYAGNRELDCALARGRGWV